MGQAAGMPHSGEMIKKSLGDLASPSQMILIEQRRPLQLFNC